MLTLTLFIQLLFLVHSLRYKGSNEFTVNEKSNEEQSLPSICTISNGTAFVVVWANRTNNKAYISGKVFHSNGSVLVPQFQINQGEDSTTNFPSVTASPDGSHFTVVWIASDVVIGRIFTSDCLPMTNDIYILTDIYSGHTEIGLIYVKTTEVAVTIYQTDFEIYMFRFDQNLNQITPSAFICDVDQPREVSLHMSSNNDATEFVILEDIGDSLVYISSFRDTYSKISGGKQRVNNDDIPGSKRVSSAFLQQGSTEYIVSAWTCTDPEGFGICASYFTPGATEVISEFQINNQTAGDQYDPSIVRIDYGGAFVAVWTNNDQISGIVYDMHGARVCPEFNVTNIKGGSKKARVTSIGDGKKFVVVWQTIDNSEGLYWIGARIFEPAYCSSPFDYYYIDFDLCLPDCESRFRVNESGILYCDVTCLEENKFYIFEEGFCNATCSARGHNSQMYDNIHLCQRYCKISQYFYEDNGTCSNYSCEFPFKIKAIDGVNLCEKPCGDDKFYADDDSCVSICNIPNVIEVLSNVTICYQKATSLDWSALNETAILTKYESKILASYMNELLINATKSGSNLTATEEKINLYMSILTQSAQDYLQISDNATVISTQMFDAYFKKGYSCSINNSILSISIDSPEIFLFLKSKYDANCSKVLLVSYFAFNSSITNTTANSSKSIISLSILDDSTNKSVIDLFSATINAKSQEECPNSCSFKSDGQCFCESLTELSIKEQISEIFSNLKLKQLDFNLFLDWKFYEDPAFYSISSVLAWYSATILYLALSSPLKQDLISNNNKKKSRFFRIGKTFLIIHPVLEIYYINYPNRSRLERSTLYLLRVLLALSMASIFSIKSSVPSIDFSFSLDFSSLRPVQILFPYFTYIPISWMIAYFLSSPKVNSSKFGKIISSTVVGTMIPVLIFLIFLIASNQTSEEKSSWILVFFITVMQDLLISPLIGLVYHIAICYLLFRYMKKKKKGKSKPFAIHILEKLVSLKIFNTLYKKKKPSQSLSRLASSIEIFKTSINDDS